MTHNVRGVFGIPNPNEAPEGYYAAPVELEAKDPNEAREMINEDSCIGCAFFQNASCQLDESSCSALGRVDGAYVIFKRKES
jgi:hypothetical protein